MYKHKNDYSVVVFFNDNRNPKKWKYVHKLNGFALFLNKEHKDWTYMNVYRRKDSSFIKRIYRTDFIPAFLD